MTQAHANHLLAALALALALAGPACAIDTLSNLGGPTPTDTGSGQDVATPDADADAATQDCPDPDPCGGCSDLTGSPGDPCGPCGTLACVDGHLACNRPDAHTYFPDTDHDGFGDPLQPTTACAPPAGYVEDATDCDDASFLTFPGAPEACDGLDNDCDRLPEPGAEDSDGDGIPNCNDTSINAANHSRLQSLEIVNLGGGETPQWSADGDWLVEDAGASRTGAILPDLGTLERYTIRVDIRPLAVNNASTNGCGLILDYHDVHDYLLVEWTDPTVQGHVPPSLRVLRCDLADCDTLATTAENAISQVRDGTTHTLHVRLTETTLSVELDREPALDLTLETPIPLGRIGLYSFDSDGGVRFGNLQVGAGP